MYMVIIWFDVYIPQYSKQELYMTWSQVYLRAYYSVWNVTDTIYMFIDWKKNSERRKMKLCPNQNGSA